MQHLLGCAAGEGEEEDPPRIHPARDEVGDAVGEGLRLSRPRTGDDQERAIPVRYGGALLWVQIVKPGQFIRACVHAHNISRYQAWKPALSNGNLFT